MGDEWIYPERNDDSDIEIIEPDTDLQAAVEMSWETHIDTGVRQLMQDDFSHEEKRHRYAEFMRESYKSSSVEFNLIEGEHESDYYCYLCTRFPFNAKICTNCRRMQCYHCYLRLRDVNPVPKCQNDRNGPCILQDVDEIRQNRMNTAKITCNFGCAITLEYVDADLHHTRGNCPNGTCQECGLYKYSKKRHNSGSDCVQELIRFSQFLEAKNREELMEKENRIGELQRQLSNQVANNNNISTRLEAVRRELNRRHDVNGTSLISLSARRIGERRLNEEQNRRTQTENELSRVSAQLEMVQQQNLELIQQLQTPRQMTIATNPTDGGSDINRNEPRVVHINSPEFGMITLNQRIYRTATTWDRLIEMALTQYNISTEEAIRRTADYAFYDIRTHIRRGSEMVGGFLRQNHVLNLVRGDFLTSGTSYMLSIPENLTTFPLINTPNNASEQTTRASGLPRGTNGATSSLPRVPYNPRNSEDINSLSSGSHRGRHREHSHQRQHTPQHRRYSRRHRD